MIAGSNPCGRSGDSRVESTRPVRRTVLGRRTEALFAVIALVSAGAFCNTGNRNITKTGEYRPMNDTMSSIDWERYREEFPITERYVYFNHAAVSPLSTRVAAWGAPAHDVAVDPRDPQRVFAKGR